MGIDLFERPGSSLSNVTVRYAGDTDGNGVASGDVKAIEVQSDITLTNVNVETSYGGGLFVQNGATVVYNGGRLDSTTESGSGRSAIGVDGFLTATNLDIIGHDGPGDTGIGIGNGFSATISNSSFIKNTTAVQHNGTDPGNAVFENNWWASAGGPHDPSAADAIVNDNPDGQPVSDYVAYGNFLTTPPVRATGPRITDLQPLSAVAAPVHHRYEAEGAAYDESATQSGARAGDSAYAPGRTGGLAFSLDGDDAITLGNTWPALAEWTLAAWVNPTAVEATGRTGIVGGDANASDWSINIEDGNYVAKFKNNETLDSGIAAQVDVWTHVAATLRGSMLHLYIDGVLQASTDIGELYVPTTSGVRIGSTAFNGAGFFTGLIDEVSIVERSLTDAEIITLKDTGSVASSPDKERYLVVFDRPINSSSVGVEDVSLSGPTTVAVESVDPVGDRAFVFTLDGSLTNAGSYVFSIGPEIEGTSCFLMDQDADGIAGEVIEDVFTTTLNVDLIGPRITAQNPDGSTDQVLTSIDVTFNEAVDPKSFTPDSVNLLTPAMIDAREAYDPAETQEGFLVRGVRSNAAFDRVEFAERILQDSTLSSETQSASFPVLNFGPQGVNFGSNNTLPLDGSGTNDHLVWEATAKVTIPSAGMWTFAVSSDDGYRLEIGSFVAEFPTGRGIDTDLVTFDFPSAGEYDFRFVFFELIGSSGFELSAAPGEKTEFDSDFKLLGDTATGGLAVRSQLPPPTDSIRALSVVPVDGSGVTYRITFPPQPLDGQYELQIDPHATDLQGNPLDQDNDGVGGEPEQDRYIRQITVTRDPLRVIAQNPTNAINGALEEFHGHLQRPD